MIQKAKYRYLTTNTKQDTISLLLKIIDNDIAHLKESIRLN